IASSTSCKKPSPRCSTTCAPVGNASCPTRASSSTARNVWPEVERVQAVPAAIEAVQHRGADGGGVGNTDRNVGERRARGKQPSAVRVEHVQLALTPDRDERAGHDRDRGTAVAPRK